ncbi:MAG: alkanesulfonate monooxygenase SsuD [Gammaproteobacteria bacterium]|jgi:alkanesulfonate monooxygenase SsuD/methylene tetrahydromethanopterin reductase-like flavin-dependent oxidoreductase (luciferase family)
MRVGYFPCTQDAPNGANVATMIDEIIEQAKMCESVGFDGFFFTEHHQQEDAYLPAPVLMAGLVGMHTTTLNVGTCVLLMPLYHPIRLAEDIAVIDQATKGRFLAAAAGIGYQPADFDAFGVRQSQRVRRTEEGVDILRHAWSGEKFSYPSKYHTIEDVRVTPRPYQDGGPPIWLAGWSPPGLARAGRMADAWIADPIQSISVIKDYADQYRAEAKKHGRDPSIILMRDCVIGTSREDTIAKSKPTMDTHRWYYEFGGYIQDEHTKDLKGPQDLTFEIASKERLIAGTPEECLEQLSMWSEVVQPDYLMLRMRQAGGPPQAEALEDIRLFGEKVIPKL